MKTSLKKQSGVALLALSVALVTTTSAMLAISLATRVVAPVNTSAIDDLHSVKSALLAYAATHDSKQGPGRLPCPDLSGDGMVESSCNGKGRGVVPARSVDRLWQPARLSRPVADITYAIDRNFQHRLTGGGPPFQLNSNSVASLSLDGEGDYVAILMISGSSSGTSSDTANPVNESNSTFTRSTLSGSAERDMVVGIRRSEVMTIATAAVANLIKVQLDTHYRDKASYPVSQSDLTQVLSDMPDWFRDDGWQSQLSYSSNASSFVLRFNGCGISFSGDAKDTTLNRDNRQC